MTAINFFNSHMVSINFSNGLISILVKSFLPNFIAHLLNDERFLIKRRIIAQYFLSSKQTQCICDNKYFLIITGLTQNTRKSPQNLFPQNPRNNYILPLHYYLHFFFHAKLIEKNKKKKSQLINRNAKRMFTRQELKQIWSLSWKKKLFACVDCIWEGLE